MPTTLTFGDRHARNIRDNLDDLLHDNDNSLYAPFEYSDITNAFNALIISLTEDRIYNYETSSITINTSNDDSTISTPSYTLNISPPPYVVVTGFHYCVFVGVSRVLANNL